MRLRDAGIGAILGAVNECTICGDIDNEDAMLTALERQVIARGWRVECREPCHERLYPSWLYAIGILNGAHPLAIVHTVEFEIKDAWFDFGHSDIPIAFIHRIVEHLAEKATE